MAQTGGCLCGRVRYRVEGQPLAVMVCHCTHCQRQSGSAFSINIVVPLSNLELVGPLRDFDNTSDDGGAVKRRFCPDCGSPFLSELGRVPGVAAIKAGTLDDTSDLTPGAQFWTQSRQSWITRLELPEFEKGPPQ